MYYSFPHKTILYSTQIYQIHLSPLAIGFKLDAARGTAYEYAIL
jgi:hypothetical protein